MNGWELPVAATISGKDYSINTDYRDLLEIIDYLQNQEVTEQEKVYIALSLFYSEFESMPCNDWQEAFAQLILFIDCGEVHEDASPSPKRIDWKQDRLLIVADINKAAGCEVRTLEYMHWWTFVAWFNCIGEGQLATVCAIRDKRRRGKALEPWEREFYAENRAKVDFKTRYTAEEEAEQARLLALLGEG